MIGEIKDIINSHEAVKGTYDVVINNYGPVAHTGSVHIAVLDTMKAEDIDVLTRWIVREVKQKTHVFLTGVSIYSINTCDKEVIDLRNDVRSIIDKEPHVHDMHGFYYDKEKHSIRFDALMPSLILKTTIPRKQEIPSRIKSLPCILNYLSISQLILI